MPTANPHENGTVQHWVTVRAEPAGQFTAQAVGLPDIRATADSREEALARVQVILRGMVASGTLAAMELPVQEPQLSSTRWDPNDPEMLAFMEILDHQSKEDLAKTLQDLDQECSNSSSIPTT